MTLNINDPVTSSFQTVGNSLVSILKDDNGTLKTDHNNPEVKGLLLFAALKAHDVGVFADSHLTVDDSQAVVKVWKLHAPLRLRVKKRALLPRSLGRTWSVVPAPYNPNPYSNTSPFGFSHTTDLTAIDPTVLISGLEPGYNHWQLNRLATGATGGVILGGGGSFNYHYGIDPASNLQSGSVIAGVAVGFPSSITESLTINFEITSGTPSPDFPWGFLSASTGYQVVITAL